MASPSQCKCTGRTVQTVSNRAGQPGLSLARIAGNSDARLHSRRAILAQRYDEALAARLTAIRMPIDLFGVGWLALRYSERHACKGPRPSGTTRQAIENLDAAVDCPASGRVTESEVGIHSAEYVAGNDEELVADRLGHELGGGSPGCPGEHVEGTARPFQLEAVL